MQQSTSFLRRTSASSGHAWGCTHGYIYIGAIRRPSNSVLACHRRRYQHHRRAIVTRAAEGDARDGKSSNKKLVTVKFLLPNCFCQFNERLRIVGSGANTGLWTADASPEEDGKLSGYWSAEVKLPPGRYAFKVTTLKGDGTVDWEKGKSREFEVPASAGKSMLHTVPSGTIEEMEPISINLERWFDVDALITGLEAKRRSLRSSIEELKTIVQNENDGETQPKNNNADNDKSKRGRGWGVAMGAKGDDNGSGGGGMAAFFRPKKRDDKGGDGGGGGQRAGSALTSYTARMQAEESEYMGRVWQDLVSEVVKEPSREPSRSNTTNTTRRTTTTMPNGAPQPTRTASPMQPPPPPSKGDDLGFGVTRLSLLQAAEQRWGWRHPLQLADPTQQPHPPPTAQPRRRPWVFDPKTGRYRCVDAVSDDDEEACGWEAVEEDPGRALEALEREMAALDHAALGGPLNLPENLPNPTLDFLLLDTDCVPQDLHTTTLANAFGGSDTSAAAGGDSNEQTQNGVHEHVNDPITPSNTPNNTPSNTPNSNTSWRFPSAASSSSSSSSTPPSNFTTTPMPAHHQDTDSVAIPPVESDDTATHDSPFSSAFSSPFSVNTDMLLRCEGSPFSGMDFNTAFRIASSSFPRPTTSPDDPLEPPSPHAAAPSCSLHPTEEEKEDYTQQQQPQQQPLQQQQQQGALVSSTYSSFSSPSSSSSSPSPSSSPSLSSPSSSAVFAALGTLAGIDRMVKQGGGRTSGGVGVGGVGGSGVVQQQWEQGEEGGPVAEEGPLVLEIVVDEDVLQEWLTPPPSSPTTTTTTSMNRIVRLAAMPRTPQLLDTPVSPPPPPPHPTNTQHPPTVTTQNITSTPPAPPNTTHTTNTPATTSSKDATTLGDVHACLQEISSRLDMLLKNNNTPLSTQVNTRVNTPPWSDNTPPARAASLARASASSLLLRAACMPTPTPLPPLPPPPPPGNPPPRVAVGLPSDTVLAASAATEAVKNIVSSAQQQAVVQKQQRAMDMQQLRAFVSAALAPMVDGGDSGGDVEVEEDVWVLDSVVVETLLGQVLLKDE